MGDPFFDTNVLPYLLSGDASKADRAEALVAAGGIISVQVLNEFASVASRKLGMSWPEILEVLETIRAVCVESSHWASIHMISVWHLPSVTAFRSTMGRSLTRHSWRIARLCSPETCNTGK
jgi:predicted nucleic acid-binding protein